FFFSSRRRHTILVSDWSSDVCSSDLNSVEDDGIPAESAASRLRIVRAMSFLQWLESTWVSTTLRDSPNIFLYPTILAFHTLALEIGRASCRESRRIPVGADG